MEDAICSAEVRDVEVLLTPKLLDQIDEGLRDEIADTISISICQTLEQYMNKFEERFNKLIRTPLINIQVILKLFEKFLFNYNHLTVYKMPKS